MKRSVEDIDLKGKRVLMRADFNVPLEYGKVADDFRIRASLPTIEYILDHGASLVLCSHLGRPGGEVVEALRLEPVAHVLSELLHQGVKNVDDCIGKHARDAALSLNPGEVLLLENTRFHTGEKENDPDFAKDLAEMGELFVNDAFAAAHRAHASTTGVARYLPAVAGLLMTKEIEVLSRVREDPKSPLVMVLGGAKVSDKIGMLEHFLNQADALLLGGGIANTVLKAKGIHVSASLVDEKSLETARQMLENAAGKLVCPKDVVIAKEKDAGADHRTISVGEDRIPDGWMILDIGPRTIAEFEKRLADANTVLWNGPLGVFELQPFSQGTMKIAEAVAGLDAETVTGGGETAAAMQQAGVISRIDHVSTGGGAFLKFMQAGELPGIAVLQEKEVQVE